MGRINAGKVVVGGLLAGLILNVFDYLVNGMMLKNQWEAAMAGLHLPPAGGSAITIFVVADFLIGIVLIWLYAAIRPRFGPGPKTAVTASLMVWLLGYVFALLAPMIMEILPKNLVLTMVAAGLVQVVVAGLAGAAIYKE